MENIWMMFLGMAIWQTLIFLLLLFDKIDDGTIQIVSTGIWGLLWFIIIKPIVLIVDKIRIAIFNKEYACLSFCCMCNNGLVERCKTFWAKRDVVERLYITDNPQKENRDCVQIINIKVENFPHQEEILTPDKLENGFKKWTADFFRKFLK